MNRVTDEEYYEHWGEWYSLGDETDTLVALLSMAVAGFRTSGFPEPVNAVEIGWNLEGSFLNACFVSNPDYACYGQTPSQCGVCRRGNVVAHTSNFSVPSWAFLFAQTSPNLARPLLRVLDQDRVEVTGRAIHDAVGKNLLRVVLECRETVFAGVSFTDPHWLIVHYCEDCDEAQLVRVSGGETSIFAPPPGGLSRKWFVEKSGK